MGDAKAGPIRLSFNPQLRVEFHGATVTSDAGLLLPRELDERLGLSALIERHLIDPRTGRNYQFPLPDLFRQSIYSRLAGYEDTNDAERLAEDPTVSDAGRARAAGEPYRAYVHPALVRNGSPRGGAELSGTHAPQYGPGAARRGPPARAASEGRETRSGSIPAGVSLRWGGHGWRAPEHAGSAGQEAREPPVIDSEWAKCLVGGRAAHSAA